MFSTKTFVAVAALVALSVNAQAGLFGHDKGCGASKCCDCAPTFQPDCCRPTITRPCHVNVYNYQRSCAKPMGCCDGCAPAQGCCPAGDNCAPACNTGCGPTACAAPCGNGCGPAVCAAPCGDACAPVCSSGCHKDGGLFGWFKKGHGHSDCGAPCDSCCDTCCPTADPCEIAELIYQSQTACYPRQRKHAINKLGNRYDCVCNPEIMCALIYALNDADPHVRAAAADEIGDQLRKNPCCCSQNVVSALTCALADCSKHVRKQAEEGLEACGYDVVDACCDTCCDTCCNTGCAPAGSVPAGVTPMPVDAPQAAPMNNEGAAPPAPAPPAEGDRAYFPKRVPQQTSRQGSLRNSLSNLFSLVD